ncbi:MAG: hypothetical protein WAX77_11735 [Methylococcaceae bacterium]
MSINGAIITDFGGYDRGQSIVAQADGKIVVLGTAALSTSDGLAVARYNSNGSLDTSFSGDGKLTAVGLMPINAMYLLSNGKFLTIGAKGGDFAVARYNSDGTADKTFSGDGILTTNVSYWDANDAAYNLVIQVDGKTVVVGYESYYDVFAATRYNSDGSLDMGFANDGILSGRDVRFIGVATCAFVGLDGKILLAGDSNNDFGIMRLNRDGSLDASFSGDGMVTTDIGGSDSVYAVTILSTGKILVVGNSDGNFAAVRYNVNGSLDTSFGGTGIITGNAGINEVMSGVVALKDGKFLVGGTNGNYDLVLERYNIDGSLDASFGTNGRVITDLGGAEQASGLAVQSDGKILLTGSSDSDFILVRYNADGSLDSAFNGTNNHLPTGTVTLTGLALSGQTLTVSNTLADVDGLGVISYAWLANGVAITNASGNSYTLTSNEVGKTISVVASYTDNLNFKESVTSAATAKVIGDLVIYGDVGGSSADIISGDISNDKLYGLNMNDSLSGLAGNDTLYGGYGNDTLLGGESDDALFGEQDADSLVGGTGNDTLDGGLGADSMSGGIGNDTYYLSYDASDVITDNGLSSDVDTIIMPYQLTSYTLPKDIENGAISAGTQASSLTGNSNDNILSGNDGKNTLSGSLGRDSLFGGAGNDILTGGVGNDTLTGGVGKDNFKFDAIATATNNDTITDFKVIDDTIQLKASVFTALSTKGILDASNFVVSTAAIDSNDYIIYNKASGALLYDADGNGAGLMTQITLIGSNLAVTNVDFVVV